MRVYADPKQRVSTFFDYFKEHPLRDFEVEYLADIASKHLEYSIQRPYTKQNVKQVELLIRTYYDASHVVLSADQCRRMLKMLEQDMQ